MSLADQQKQETAWYCVKTQPKREHLAAASIRQQCQSEVFCPRVRFPKVTKRGKVNFVEALFPSYIFAKIQRIDFRHLMAQQGVSTIVHFGTYYPTMPEELIDSLKKEFDNQEIYECPKPHIEPGAEVTLLEGAFANFTATVLSLSKGKDRVTLLIDFLGRETPVTTPVYNVMTKDRNPVYDPFVNNS